MLKGKTAVITGGSRGIGAAIAMKLADEGSDIALIYAGNDEAAQKTRDSITGKGVRCNTYKCDVSNFEDSRRIVEKIISDNP